MPTPHVPEARLKFLAARLHALLPAAFVLGGGE
jgi:hypothetical protein